MQRSKLVLGFVVALGVGGLGAAAVAMENDTGATGSLAATTTIVVEPSTTVPTVASTPATTAAPTTGAAGSTDGSTEDPEGTDGGVERSTEGCDGGTYANHGDYVSSVAHDPDRQPGDVPAAAQSDCGKPIPSVDGDDVETPDAPEAPETETGDGAGSPGQGQGKGKSLAKGQG